MNCRQNLSGLRSKEPVQHLLSFSSFENVNSKSMKTENILSLAAEAAAGFTLGLRR